MVTKAVPLIPTATQNVELVQVTLLRLLTVEGRLLCAQVEPPSVVI